jgi:hypothetical protein
LNLVSLLALIQKSANSILGITVAASGVPTQDASFDGASKQFFARTIVKTPLGVGDSIIETELSGP